MVEYEFSIRLRVGQREIELRGKREEVLDIIENRLDEIVGKISGALGSPPPKGAPSKVTISAGKYPIIRSGASCSEAVTDLLSSEWGKHPRTSSEILEAMKANAVLFPKTTLSGVLKWMTRKGKLRRWKKGTSYVYVFRKGD